jgi:hypothetical protein
MYGTGQETYKAMQQAIEHPPKNRFLEISANELASNPELYLPPRSSGE